MTYNIQTLDDLYRSERLGRHLPLLRLIYYWSFVSLVLTFAYLAYRVFCNIDTDGSLSFWDSMAIWSFLGLELGNIGKRKTLEHL